MDLQAAPDLYYRFIVTLLIGILVGLEREYSHDLREEEIFAGVRTFALMALIGAVAAMITDQLESAWIFVSIVLLLGGMITVSYFISASKGQVGVTTEVAALVTILAGGLCYWGYVQLAVAIAVAVTVLLSLKLEMRAFVQRLTKEDIYATLKFAVIVVIVLPVLPDQPLGSPPFDVLNLYKIWLMVVFISGISFLGYLLSKLVGAERGIGLTGLLGGLVSSTAVTLSFSQRSQTEPDLSRPFALAIIGAWTVMFGRVIVEVAALNVPLLEVVWIPLAASAAVGLAYGLYLYFRQQSSKTGEMEFTNPFTLGPAVKFGLLYAGILLVSSVAQTTLGDTGVYLSSVVAGTADVDAITLSMAELAGVDGEVSLGTAAMAIVLAITSNVVVKGGIVLMSGSKALRRALLPGFVLMLVTGVVVALMVAG